MRKLIAPTMGGGHGHSVPGGNHDYELPSRVADEIDEMNEMADTPRRMFAWSFVAHEKAERLPRKDLSGKASTIDRCFRAIQEAHDKNLNFKETFVDGDALLGVHEVHLPHRFNSQAFGVRSGDYILGTIIISPASS